MKRTKINTELLERLTVILDFRGKIHAENESGTIVYRYVGGLWDWRKAGSSFGWHIIHEPPKEVYLLLEE